jgi:hypothetical protein
MWVAVMRLLEPDSISVIVIHTTVSPYGNVDTITRWHRQVGFETIGYHFIILNCFPTYRKWIDKQPDPWSDGKSRPGRQLIYQGAHVRGHNNHSIGIAMIGRDGQFSSAQLKTAVMLCRDMQKRFPHITAIKGHTELDDKKACPETDMDQFRHWVNGGWQ